MIGIQRALVTGASGLIGSNLTRELLARGVRVRAMTRPGSDLRALAALPVERVIADVRDPPDTLAPLCSDQDVVFHAAARFTYADVSEKELEDTACSGTRNVLAAAARAGVRRVVVTSSSVIFGSSSSPRVRDETAHPDEDFTEPPYVRAKIRQDTAAAGLAHELGLDVVFACPTLSVGPHGTALGPSNGAIVSYLADPLRASWPGGCNFVSVRDVARAQILIAERGASGEHYLVGSDNTTWPEVHALIARLCGVPAPRMQLNHTAAYWGAAAEEIRARLAGRAALATRQQARMVGRFYWYSHAKAAALGYAPVALPAVLAEACAWLAASDHVSRELRTTLTLSSEVHAARRRLMAETAGGPG